VRRQCCTHSTLPTISHATMADQQRIDDSITVLFLDSRGPTSETWVVLQCEGHFGGWDLRGLFGLRMIGTGASQHRTT